MQDHEPAGFQQLIDIGGDYRRVVRGLPWYTQVFVHNVNGQQRIMGAMHIRELQLNAQPAGEDPPPAVQHPGMSAYTISHGMDALDKIALRPDLGHEFQIRVLERSIKCLFGFFGGGES